nr:YhfC family intramembrane metalloprotease [Saccharofermentans sp.]
MDIINNATVSDLTLALIAATAILAITIPVLITGIWCKKKREPVTTALIAAAFFFVFVILLEKPIQNVIIFPTAMGLPETSVSRFINGAPILWAFLLGFFPGLFEETGRFVAFKTILRKRKQRETSITYGLGHGLFEVMFIIGITFVQYFIYAVMLRQGTFASLLDTVPSSTSLADLEAQIAQVVESITSYDPAAVLLTIVERIGAVLFHTGATILVFYAVKDRKKLWLYPLSIALHTLLDGIVGLRLAGVISMSD